MQNTYCGAHEHMDGLLSPPMVTMSTALACNASAASYISPKTSAEGYISPKTSAEGYNSPKAADAR